MSTKTFELPAPGYPILTRMISNALFPPDDPAKRKEPEEPLTWAISLAHPLVPEMKIVRMFVDRGGVEVYSVSADGKNGMRNLVPMHWVRLIEEAMPLEVFVEELAAAEADDGVDEEEEPEPEIQAPASNGQAAS